MTEKAAQDDIAALAKGGRTNFLGFLLRLAARSAPPSRVPAPLPGLIRSRTSVAAAAPSPLPRRSVITSVGFAASLIVAFIVVKWLLGYIRTHRFTPFAIYRIALGVALLWWLPAGG